MGVDVAADGHQFLEKRPRNLGGLHDVLSFPRVDGIGNNLGAARDAVLYERFSPAMRARVKYWLAPEQRSIELVAADYGTQRFSPHWHSGFAVGVVTRNRQRFLADGEDRIVGPGDVILLNPGQLHDGSSLHVEGWTSRMAYIPESTFAAMVARHAGNGTFPLRFHSPVVHAPELAHMFAAWHGSTEQGPPDRHAPRTADVLEVVMQWMRPVSRVSFGDDPASLSLVFSERLRMLSQDGPTGLDSWLPLADGPRTTSWRRVRARFGIAAQPLQTHLRLVSARRLLAAGAPVVDAALGAGYYDQSHLTRQFTAAYGMTPALFRKVQLDRR
jgi:quercetin dioxygenase-like cupin family protein